MRRASDLLGLICSFLIIILVVLFGTPAKSQSVPDFDHSKFYKAKIEISEAILDVARSMRVKPDKDVFQREMNARLALLGATYPIDYTVIVYEPKDPNLPELITVTLIGYEDEGGFIGWKFDTLFSGEQVFAFVIALQDRTIPDITWDEYYRYKVIKS